MEDERRMSETKILTLDEAKQQIAGYRKALADGPSWARTLKSQAEALGTALNILARVEHSSEEDMAVLWLMKKADYDVCFEKDHYAVYRRVDEADNAWCWVSDNPADEAKKLGWKP